MVYDLRKALRTIDEYVDIDIVATRIRRLHKLVHVAAAHVFKETYKDLNHFDYKLEQTGTNEIDEDTTLMEVQKIVTSKTKVVLSYRMICDDGSGTHSDLNTRYSRGKFIEDMIKFINSRPIKNKLNIQKINFKTSDGGKNPTLQVSIRYYHKKPDPKKPGTIKTVHTDISFNFSMKYGGSSKDGEALAKLKPAMVEPSILNQWLTPQEMYDNVVSYIRGPKFPSQNKGLQEMYVNAVHNSFTNNSLKDDLGIAAEFSSEFFEILSCLKLAKLLRQNDSKMLDIVGHDGDRINSVKINIPQAANEALIDYKIAVNDQFDSPLKISVKSKVRGGSTATVKFTTAFANEAEVHSWFKGLKYTSRKNYNMGQRMVASSALEYKNYSKRGTLYPLRALKKLLKGSKSIQVSSDFKAIFNTSAMNVNDWYKVIDIMDRKITTVSKNGDPLDNFIVDKDLLLKTKKFIADNLFGDGGMSSKSKVLKSLISLDIATATSQSPIKGKYPFSVNNLAYLCERVLVRTSQKGGNTKMNFYKMFYDQVLKKEAVVYSITDIDTSSDETKLEFKFISTKNFRQYKNWVALRSKNYANNMQDALGMAV